MPSSHPPSSMPLPNHFYQFLYILLDFLQANTYQYEYIILFFLLFIQNLTPGSSPLFCTFFPLTPVLLFHLMYLGDLSGSIYRELAYSSLMPAQYSIEWMYHSLIVSYFGHWCCFQSFDLISNSVITTLEHMSFYTCATYLWNKFAGFLSQRICAFITMNILPNCFPQGLFQYTLPVHSPLAVSQLILTWCLLCARSILNALYTLPHLILITSFGGRYYYYLHFSGE